MLKHVQFYYDNYFYPTMNYDVTLEYIFYHKLNKSFIEAMHFSATFP